MQYFDVYIDGIKDLYTYSDKDDIFEVGDNVLVYFRNTKKTAFIMKKNNTEIFDFKVLNILSKLNNSFKLSKNQIDLINWMVEYYLSSYDTVIKTVIPKKVKIKSNYKYSLNLNNVKEKSEIINYFFSLSKVSLSTAIGKFKKSIITKVIDKEYLILEENTLIPNFNKIILFQKEYEKIFEYFYEKMIVKKEKLEKLFSREKIKKLEKENILKLDIEFSNKKIFVEDLTEVKKNISILSDEQEKVKNEIKEAEEKYFLIKGITGSGKTEIYLELIKEAFFKGQGSIFLVPEISLTPQMINKFKNEFKDNIAILHSRLTENERAKEWESLYSGEKKIVLGARSAIFAPVQNLKYIILDEEHENTYKQDNNPRYNAKYVAIKRCLLENCKLILGSATPSIESYFYSKTGVYKLLEMNKRYGDSEIPEIEIVDMKQEEDLFFSKKLLKEIKETLIKKEQVILLLNRKGYSTYIQCKDCGHAEECPSCSIKMNYYSSMNKLKCNYCGRTVKYTGTCSSCGSKNLIHSGKGIERVEEELKKYFNVPILKVDGDNSKDKEFFTNMYRDFLDNKYSILIGTQIIAKGFHFPNVTLVGVINSDLTLNFPDFRAGERTYQLLTQVAGRAGRAEKKGKVIFQTYEEENYAIKNSSEENFNLFYNIEIKMREKFFYPPFSKLINIGISSLDEKKCLDIAKKVYQEIKTDSVNIYDPIPSLVYKVKNRYRMNIFIKGNKKEIDKFKKVLKKKVEKFYSNDVRLIIDIDPMSVV